MAMKSDIWTFLGIAPTSDKKTIRSAYAAQSRLHHPEEEPEYFVELNQAYRQALSLARTAEADGSSENRISRSGEEDRNSNHTEFTQLNTGTGNEKDKEESASLLERLADARQKAIQQSMETGALHDFITLFTNPKQAKAADTWKRFFLSEAFLREQYTEDFARGLYTYLMEQQLHPCDNLPAGLLQELAIAYALIPHFAGEEYGQGMKYPKEWYKVSVEQTLPARKQIAEIFNRQGWDCDLKSMTRRMLKQPANKVRHNAFTDYLTLKEMGQKGQLTEADKET